MAVGEGGKAEGYEVNSPVATTWSAVSPGDLGLKAGVRAQSGEVVFRPILGWVTVTERRIGTDDVQNQLHPVLLNEVGYPTLAMFVNGCVGVFPKDMSHEQAVEFSKRWAAKLEAAPPALGKMLN